MTFRNLFQDYETFYGSVKEPDGTTLSLSLKNKQLAMTEYIRHPQFQVHGVSLQFDDMPEPEFFKAHEIPGVYKDIDWSKYRVVAHNALFEGNINFEHYGIVPGAYFCTMAMAEATFQGATAVGLDALAKYCSLGEKLPDLEDFRNVRTEDITPSQWGKLARYANNDVSLTKSLFGMLAHGLPEKEWRLMSHTIMLFANPKLRVNVPLAEEALADAIKERAEKVAATGHTEKEISGNHSFRDLLRAELGFVPMKKSPTTGKLTEAFAKDDVDFVALRSHENTNVRALVEARLAVKSNQSVTRPKRIIAAGTTGSKTLPVCLHYARAHTMRWSGGNKMNLQNLERGGKLRRSMIAPPGYVIVVVDSSQIECRSNGCLHKQEDLLQQFRDGLDPYGIMAEKVYGYPVSKDENSPHYRPDERFIGKTMTLALGYGMGWWKFWVQMVTGARGKAMPIDHQFAQNAVNIYRSVNSRIVNGWEQAEEWMGFLATGRGTKEVFDGLLTLDAENKKVIFPGGRYLRYPLLEYVDGGFRYLQVKREGGAYWSNIWGGHFVENYIQSFARHVVADQILEVVERADPALLVHDEGAFLVPERDADDFLAFAIGEFSRRPSWVPDTLPLAAEGGYDYCYSK